jgi:hypothetical protein
VYGIEGNPAQRFFRLLLASIAIAVATLGGGGVVGCIEVNRCYPGIGVVGCILRREPSHVIAVAIPIFIVVAVARRCRWCVCIVVVLVRRLRVSGHPCLGDLLVRTGAYRAFLHSALADFIPERAWLLQVYAEISKECPNTRAVASK